MSRTARIVHVRKYNFGMDLNNGLLSRSWVVLGKQMGANPSIPRRGLVFRASVWYSNVSICLTPGQDFLSEEWVSLNQSSKYKIWKVYSFKRKRFWKIDDVIERFTYFLLHQKWREKSLPNFYLLFFNGK